MNRFYLFCIFLLLAFNYSFGQKRPDHVVVVILENHSYNQIIGNSLAPYINKLSKDANAALLTKSFGLIHPSQPNYIMLFSGDNQGIINDNLPTTFPFTSPNLGANLLKNGFSFTGYSETMPSVGFNGTTSGKYARKHNPWANWQGNAANGIASNLNQPFTAFPTNYSSLPTVSFIIPNLDDDMHDGTILMGDTWVQTNLDAYIQWCKTNNSLLILTFDEDNDTPINQIPTIIVGQDVIGGNYAQTITHYNVLRTIEDLYGLPLVGRSADSTGIQKIWKSIPTPITIEKFQVSNYGDYNSIQWTSLIELKAENYEIEKSVDGILFYKISSLKSKGNHGNYQFNDYFSTGGSNYYRLRMIDNDGSFKFSSIVKIENTKLNSMINIFPNPVQNLLNVFTKSNKAENVQLIITNHLGKVVLSKYVPLLLGDNNFKLNTSELSKGVYYLQLIGVNQLQKFIKE